MASSILFSLTRILSLYSQRNSGEGKREREREREGRYTEPTDGRVKGENWIYCHKLYNVLLSTFWWLPHVQPVDGKEVRAVKLEICAYIHTYLQSQDKKSTVMAHNWIIARMFTADNLVGKNTKDLFETDSLFCEWHQPTKICNKCHPTKETEREKRETPLSVLVSLNEVRRNHSIRGKKRNLVSPNEG